MTAPAPMRQAGGTVTPSRTVLLRPKYWASTSALPTNYRAGGEKAVIVDPGVMRDTGLATDYTIIAN